MKSLDIFYPLLPGPKHLSTLTNLLTDIYSVVSRRPKEAKAYDSESSDSEEGSFTVSTITHYNKDYYIIDGEEPIQYIYAIEDGELGEKKGVMKNGKKKMYKKN